MPRLTSEMLISHDPNETRVAILENGELVEYYIERTKRSVVGNVYLGKVKDVLPGMEAAFVDIGLEKNGFLYVDEVIAPEGVEEVPKREIAQLLKPGQETMVQVVKDPMGTKGARVTTEISLPGRFIVLMPFSEFVGVSRRLPDAERDRLHASLEALPLEGKGAIVRTAAQGASEKDLASDIDFLLRLWRRVQHQARDALAPEILYTEMDLALRMVRDVFVEGFARLVVDDKSVYEKVVSFLKKTSPDLVKRVSLHGEQVPLFVYFDISGKIDSAMKRRVQLPSGGYISIDRTEALTAIDVNTGKFVGRKSLEDTIVRTNLEAAEETVRQLRLRDLGGIIVIDFIDMADPTNRTKVFRKLSHELEKDRTKTRVMEISRLGLVEMTRKNVSEGFWAVLTETCPRCEGQARVLSDPTRRVLVERRMREILSMSKQTAFLFGVHPETYSLITGAGHDVPSLLRAETGKRVSVVPDKDCDETGVKVLIEGRPGS